MLYAPNVRYSRLLNCYLCLGKQTQYDFPPHRKYTTHNYHRLDLDTTSFSSTITPYRRCVTPNRKARVIARPKSGTWKVPQRGSETVGLAGEGDITIICGNCDMVLAKNMMPGQLASVVVRCPRCGCNNEVSEACA